MTNWIKQGDAYGLPVFVSLNGTALAVDDISTLEVLVGGVRKVFPGEVRFSREDGCFYVPLTQEETLGFPANRAVACDVRVKLTGGDVLGARKMCYLTVYDAVSEEVL